VGDKEAQGARAAPSLIEIVGGFLDMKKLIVLSVIFALVAGGLFAVDLTGVVFGRANLIQGSTQKDSDLKGGGKMERIRIEGSGSNDDGTFGGYVRLQDVSAEFFSAYAWWKPIDQLKIIMGNNGDGFWGKEGVTGWGFNQMPYDCGVAVNPGVWYGSWGASDPYGVGAIMCNRYVFFEGFGTADKGDNGLLLEITPMDMIGINIALPYMAMDGKKLEDIFSTGVYQLNINLDVGNIAITYVGADKTADSYGVNRSVSVFRDAAGYGWDVSGAIFGYFGGSFGDLGVDVGFSYHMAEESLPIGVGLGLKYATDSWGVKFRATAVLPSDDYKTMHINASVLPYFTLSDSLSAFVNAGLGLSMPDGQDTVVGWYFNPYLRVGAEWGPTFYAGIQVASTGAKNSDGDKTIGWAVPIGIMVSF
jgi:hypothetical protein